MRPFIVLLLLFLLSFFLAIWTHPLVMFAALYLWFFYWIKRDDWPYSVRQSIVFSILLLLLVFMKYYQSSHNWYDGDKIDAVKDMHISKVITIYKAPQFRYFIKECITNYWLFVLVFFMGCIALIRMKRYFLLLLTIVFSAGYVVLICITFWDLHSLRFYIESEYMPLAIIGSAPFIYFVLPRLKTNQIAAVLICIFFIRLVYIADASSFFSKRITLIENINEKMKQKKITKALMPDNDKALDSMLIMNWGLPVESIMLSELNNEMPRRTIAIADVNDINKLAHTGNDTLIGCFEKRANSQINTAYFQFDTSTKYIVLTYSQLMR